MKENRKKILLFGVCMIFMIIISYSIASVLTYKNVKLPVPLETGGFCYQYTDEQIIDCSENLEQMSSKDNMLTAGVVSGTKYQTAVEPFSRIMLDCEENGYNYGYLLMDIGTLSEENVDVRLCLFYNSENYATISQKINEGINIFKFSLKDVRNLRIDFMTSKPVGFSINRLEFSNQIFRILPVKWYLYFCFIFLLGFEAAYMIYWKENWLQKTIFNQISFGLQALMKNLQSMFIYLKKHKVAFVICFGICVFTYSYNLMNFSLGVDEEREIVRSLGSLVNVKKLSFFEGRYGMYLFKCLETLDGSFTAVVEEILAILFLFLNIVTATKCFEIVLKRKIRDSAIIVFGGMLATLPFVNAEIMCYSIMNAGVYFSIWITTMALLMTAKYFESRKKKEVFLAIVLLFCSFMCTEAQVVWFITGTILINLVWVIGNRKDWYEWFYYLLRYVGVYIISFGFYMIVRLSIGDNGYVGNYIQWGKNSPVEVIKYIFLWIWETLTNRNLPGAVYLLIGILIFMGFIVLSAVRENCSRAGLILFLSACMIFAPFSLCFIAGNRMPYRTLEALPLLEAGMWFIVLNFADKKLTARYVLTVAAICIIWKQGVWMNRIFFGADLCAKLDMEMGYEIGEEIQRVAGGREVQKPVVFVGRYQPVSPNIYRIDAVGQSIFYRISSMYKVFYLRYLGFDIQQANQQQIAEAGELVVDLASWPLEGSVQEFDDIIVVRLN